MNELQSLINLIYKIKNDEDFRKRNLSALIQNIPYIGGIIETNTIGAEKDYKLEQRLLELERISKEALKKEDINDIINIIEQNALSINSFMMEFKEKIISSNEPEVVDIKPIKVALSFVDKDLHIAIKMASQLLDNGIDVVTNNEKLSKLGNYILDYNMPISVEVLIVIYSNNYEKFSRSEYNHTTFLRIAQKRKIPIVTFAFDDLDENKLKLTNSFYKTFSYRDMDNIIPTFFFDVYKKNKKIEYDDIKRYSDVENILRLYNHEFTKIKSYQKDKIGFELYKQEQLTGINTYCIYLYDNINSKKTIEYIKSDKTNKDIFNNFFILINRPKNIQNPQKRIDYIKSLFAEREVFVFFIDDFVWDKLTSRYFEKFKKNKLPLSNFVKPYLQYKEHKFDSFNFIDNWLHQENNPILVITGSGGIGKTTLAYKITNRINSFPDRTIAIFIDAVKISATIKQYSHNDKKIDLYSFYEASHNDIKEKINPELFRINIDNGNFVIVIDGLDEIISRLGDSFNVNDFFESIRTFTQEIGNGKVILTSRNYFWDISSNELIDIDVLNILPFNKEKAEEFFQNEYPNRPSIVQKAMVISDSILGKENNNDYLPYVLELVCTMIDDTILGNEHFDPDFDSEILVQGIKTDYILGKICVRETQRVKQISVDNQLKLFFEIAINRIDVDNLKQVCNRLFENDINSRQVEAFKSHPLLQIIEGEILFKYDFFKNHIKNILLSNLFNNEEVKVNKDHIDILINNITYNSSFIKDLCDRIDDINDNTIYRALTITNEINNFSSEIIKLNSKRKANSSVFIIFLKKLHLTKSNNIVNNTELLKSFYETKSNVIDNFCIIDLSSSSNDKIIFNFNDLTLTNCYFKSYDYFWECNFNSNTKFIDSYFYSLHIPSRYKTKANIKNFIDVKGEDDSFIEVVKKSSERTIKKETKIITDLHDFLSIFCKNGQVKNTLLVNIKGKYRRKIVKLDLLLKELKKEGMIEIYEHGGKNYVKINDKYENDVLQFHSNRLTSGKIKEIFYKLVNKI